MEDRYKPPNILRLTGITLKDYVPIEDVADARLLDSGTDGRAAEPEDPAPEAAHPPDKIPRVFTGLDDWPLHTNLRCWVCDFTFDDRPKFVPTHVREGENGGIEFGVLGNMCTFNCAELWIETHLGGRASNEERWRAQDNLCLVYLIFTGRRVSRVRPAPRKTELRQYGGDWDEDTFWRRMRELDPVAGLRDHTPGSVVPERDRVRAALAILKTNADIGAPPAPRALSAAGEPLGARKPTPGEPLAVSCNSVWGVCGLPAVDGPPDSVGLDPAGPPAERRPLREDSAPLPGDLGAALGEDPAAAGPVSDQDVDALLAELGAPEPALSTLEPALSTLEPAPSTPEPAEPAPSALEPALGGPKPAPSALEPALGGPEPAPAAAVVSDYDMDLLLAELGAL